MFQVPDEYHKHIPERTINKLESWVNVGGDLSGFYWQLLSGDYPTAACNADPENLRAFGWILRCLEISVPKECYGSPEKVNAWRGWGAE
jgi:hypothetical protein